MLSQDFILLLEPQRDALYAAAVASVGPMHAESTLQNHARELFAQYLTSQSINVVQLLQQRLAIHAPQAPVHVVSEPDAVAGVENVALVPMPADVWARLAAAVQTTAAQANATALSPESGLLKPDPLLAPKKRAPRVDKENFDLSSPSRLVLIAGLTLAAGIAATVYLWMRR